MPSPHYDIVVANNESLNRQITYNDANGTPIDLTGAVVRLQARDRNGSLILDASTSNVMITLPDPTAGVILLAIPPTVTSTMPTGTYRYDLVLTLSGLSARLLTGDLTIVQGVTHD